MGNYLRLLSGECHICYIFQKHELFWCKLFGIGGRKRFHCLLGSHDFGPSEYDEDKGN